jgi:hypothetical protein
MKKDEVIESAVDVTEVGREPDLIHSMLGEVVIQGDNVDEHGIGRLALFSLTTYLATRDPEFSLLPGVLVVPYPLSPVFVPFSQGMTDSTVNGTD